MKYEYRIETLYLGDWIRIINSSRDFCRGFLHAREDAAPRNAYRIVRSDGKVIEEIDARDDVSIGQIAGWPTAGQYEAAARRALEKAEAIRAAAARDATARGR